MLRRFTRVVLLSVLMVIILLAFSLTALVLAVSSQDAAVEAKKTQVFIPFAPRALVATPTPTATPTPKPWNWLDQLNQYRAIANLPPLVENPFWSAGAALHSRYMVKTNTVTHDEDTSNPWYTAEGRAAAQSSNLIGANDLSWTSDRWALDSWMIAPFHALGILDPRLRQVGFGSYREPDGGIQMGAGLDVLRGQAELPAEIQYPILWPGSGTVVDLRMYWDETPSPLTSCPGYTSPAGLPLVIQVGSGAGVPVVTAHSFMRGSTPLEHCVFDETTYFNPDGALQGLGRAILSSRDAIILLARQPLAANTTYTASVTVDGQTHTWSFTVGNIP